MNFRNFDWPSFGQFMVIMTLLGILADVLAHNPV